MKSPNPIDQTKYIFIDTFNPAGNMASRVPTLGIPWSDQSPSDGSIVTLATGGMDFPLASASIQSVAYIPLTSVNKTISFDLALGTVKPFFLVLRNDETDVQNTSGDGIRIRIKDDATNILLLVERFNNGVSVETLHTEAAVGARIGVNARFPVVVIDDGKTIIVKIANYDPIVVVTDKLVDDQHEFIAWQAGNTTDHQVHELRIW